MGNADIDKLLRDRYLLSDEENWDDICKRLESLYPPLLGHLKEMSFLYSSPTLMNYCNNGERLGTLSSCFPMKVEDSIVDITTAMQEAAIVTKLGGGIGYDFSSLRSSRENIKTLNADSSGPVVFIEGFNVVLDMIRQGGRRRGAGMAMLDITHPNILDFINVKKDREKINRFNLSVRVPDDFYKKLRETPDAIHKVKLVTKDEEIELLDKDGGPVTVKQIWDAIISQAWDNAEPGIFNKDIAFNQCTVTHLDSAVLSNPCLRDSANFLTPRGIRNLKDVNVGDSIWSDEGWTTITNKFRTGRKRVYRFYTTAGVLEATSNHEVMSSGIKTMLENATTIDTLTGEYKKRREILPEYVMDGLVLGDGSYHKASNNLVFLYIGKDDQDYFNSEIEEFLIKDRSVGLNDWEVRTSILYHELPKTFKRKIPDRYIRSGNDEKFSFLRGLFSANGSICGDRITYKTSSFEMVKDVQLMLSSLGIRSYYTINKTKNIKFRNGEYTCRQSYDININTDRGKFYESIGFLQHYKMHRLENTIKNKKRKIKNRKVSFDIIARKDVGIHDVWDITVDNKTHTFWCDNFNISNCNEFTNIPFTSCSLASIVLSKFVSNGKFNWDSFRDLIRHGVRALNNVIDKNIYPLDKIKNITLNTRPIGLGYMGLAHALYKKGIPYNSDKAVKFTEEVTRYLTLQAMSESVELAKIDGAYPAFDYDLFIKANERFFKYKSCRDIDIEKLKKDIKKYGIRNSALTALAPTGTISTLSECSSGIEPVFALSYSRKVEVGHKEYETMFIIDSVFEEYLDSKFDSAKKEKILKDIGDNKGSCQGCKDIPAAMRKIFVVAGDITPLQHLDVLEAGARNISMSVSKTINLPEDAKREDVSNIFLEAHARGIIGVTVYRQGCREGILLTDNGEDDIIERDAPKRPKSLPCHVYKITVKGDQWVVFVGLYKNHPYEIFAGKVDLVDIPSSIKDGTITKVKSGVYRFEHNGEVLIKDIGRIFESAEQEALTRMISTNLRHGTPVNFINDQLSKSHGTIVDFNKAILRALKSYMRELKLSKQCPSCGCDLVSKEGCETCIRCGWSKCA